MSNLDDLTSIAKEKGIEVTGHIGVTYKSSWDNAPSWARWRAQSADGTWEWFSTKPQPHDFGLYVVGTFMPSGKGKKESIHTGGSHYMTKPNKEWRKTIEKRPTKRYLIPGFEETATKLDSLTIRNNAAAGTSQVPTTDKIKDAK